MKREDLKNRPYLITISIKKGLRPLPYVAWTLVVSRISVSISSIFSISVGKGWNSEISWNELAWPFSTSFLIFISKRPTHVCSETFFPFLCLIHHNYRANDFPSFWSTVLQTTTRIFNRSSWHLGIAETCAVSLKYVPSSWIPMS